MEREMTQHAITRDSYGFVTECHVCHHVTDCCLKNNVYLCFLCCIHEGSLPAPVYGPRVVVTEVVNPLITSI